MKLPVVVSLVVAVLVLAACGHDQGRQTDAAVAMSGPCAMALAPHQGTGAIDPGITSAQQLARGAVKPADAFTELGHRFVAKARASHLPAYYAMAEQAALCAESRSPGHPQALLLRGHVLHQLHRFKEAEQLARLVVEQRGSFLDHGLLGDVLLEQGRVEEAGAAYQKMLDLKPYYHSYTRAAHFRWLKGDLPGALRLIQMAVRAASPRDPESVAWAYSRQAAYELQAGRPEQALNASEAALRYQPEYPAALLIRARTLLSAGKPIDAVRALRSVSPAGSLPEHDWALIEALRDSGDQEAARQIEDRLHQTGATADPRTFALYLATRRERIDEAVELARKELLSRSDVFTFDALAWSLAAAGRTAEAAEAMEQALSEGTKDARLFYHAGVIASARGAHAEAARWLKQALAMPQMLFPSEREHAARQLEALKRPA
jgi:tetratricopeptide (TPR) repeat protein